VSTWRYGSPNLRHETVSNDSHILLIVHEAVEVIQDLDPDNPLIAHIGVRLPHPEPYAGEPDFEQFEVFVTVVL